MARRSEILERVRNIIRANFQVSVPIEENKLMKCDLGLDSLDLIQLSIQLEDEFCDIGIISIDEDKLINDLTVGELVSMIEEELFE